MEIVSYTSYSDFEISYNHKCFNDINSRHTSPQIHNAVEFIYLKKGNVAYTVDEKTYKVDSHSLIITLPDKIHTITFNDLDVYDRFDVILDERKLFPKIYERILENEKAPHVINCKNSPVFYELFKKMDFYSKRFTGDVLNNIITHLVDEIIYNIVLTIENVSDDQEVDVNSFFSRVLEYIENHLTLDLNVKNICRDLYISSSYLHNIFKEHLNITPKKYIDLKRLAVAQNYLAQGELPTSVYEKCGFSDYSVFYRSYKKYFGYPPSEEKNKNSVKEIIY